LKTKRNLLAATVLAILLASLAAPLVALSTSALDDEEDNEIEELTETHWKILKTDIITVLFPRSGRKPMFLWWYTGEPSRIYVVKYQGLIEYFAFDHPLLPPKPEYYKRLSEAWGYRFKEMYMKPLEDDLEMHMGDMDAMRKLMILREIMMELDLAWHRPFLPFSAGQWNLTDIGEIKTPDEKVIGVTFAFKLVKLPDWMPGLKFAENNIIIKVRFYNETVEETVPGTDIKYTVNAGEMKMDLVVNKWVWNIDAVKELITELQQAGIDVKVPAARTRLALWVNLASINLEQLETAKEEPPEEDRIETMSTASHMEIEGEHMSIEENRTAPPIEEQESPILVERPWWAPWLPPEKPIVRLKFAAKDKTVLGFFRFVSSAKVTTPENVTRAMPVKAAYIAAGHHLRLFIGYPYFGNSTLEHDPSIGVDVPGIETTPQYTVQAPSGISEITPTIIGKYVLPLFTLELAAVLVGAVSIVAIVIYVTKWKRKTPINMVGTS